MARPEMMTAAARLTTTFQVSGCAVSLSILAARDGSPGAAVRSLNVPPREREAAGQVGQDRNMSSMSRLSDLREPRRAGNKYVSQYRRNASARVAEHGCRR